MAGNAFGKLFTLTTFGESHGKGVGGIIDGYPSGIGINLDFIQNELNRRRPGQSKLVTPRDEKDRIEILSGVFEGLSTGTPIAFVVMNADQRSNDYNDLSNVFRPSHADYTYIQKYGIRDHRGGGRSSARETLARVAGGAFAKLLLAKLGVTVNAYVSQIGRVQLEQSYDKLDLSLTEQNDVRCPDPMVAEKMVLEIEAARADRDSLGGIITCVAKGVPAGWGEPVFDRLQADLAKAMLSINAVKGFEYGSGFAGSAMRGSQHNDIFRPDPHNPGNIVMDTNRAGGILGGISSGQDIYFRTAFKPVATIMREQNTVDKDANPVTINPKGRHDVCVVPRAVPIVEAMAAMVLVDHYLRFEAYRRKDDINEGKS
ncbi:MAG: chorismate synthase [Bacteroidota bacterium]|nr:chorismate synthase [Bacteroidota bacterium]